MPVRRSRSAGSRSSAACSSWRPRWHRSSAAAASPACVNASSSSPRCCSPSPSSRSGPARARGRDPDHGPDRPLALPRPHAAPARRRASRDRSGRGRVSRSHVGGRSAATRFSARCGTNFAALAIPVTAVFDHIAPRFLAPTLTGALVAVFSIGVSMELWKAVQQHPSGLLRGLLLPGLALQRVTTREPQLADTQVALRAVASVLRRELLGDPVGHQDRVDELVAAAVVIPAQALALEPELLVELDRGLVPGEDVQLQLADAGRAPPRLPPARAGRARSRCGGAWRRPSARDRRRGGSRCAGRGDRGADDTAPSSSAT